MRKGLKPDEPVRYVVELKVDGVAVSFPSQLGSSCRATTRRR